MAVLLNNDTSTAVSNSTFSFSLSISLPNHSITASINHPFNHASRIVYDIAGQLRIHAQWRLHPHSLRGPARRGQLVGGRQDPIAPRIYSGCQRGDGTVGESDGRCGKDPECPAWALDGDESQGCDRGRAGGESGAQASSSGSDMAAISAPLSGSTGRKPIMLPIKHRRNKNGSQRIVLFVGSPLTNVDARALAKAGRQLKKNNVAIDVVAMGELEANEEKLKELVDAANGRGDDGAERTCHLVTIPAGVLPSDVLASSPIVHGGSGGSAFAASAAAAAATGMGMGGDMGGAFADFGVDPNMDPELAMALRVSMEEERARQARMAAQQASESRAEGTDEARDAEMPDASSSAAAADVTMSAMDMGLSEEEALLQQALAMSMNENEPKSAESMDGETKPAAAAMEEDDEAAAMQLALQMSMRTDQQPEGAKKEEQQFNDPQFVNQLLGTLPGVDPNDPSIQNALQRLQGKKEGEDNNEDGDNDKKE